MVVVVEETQLRVDLDLNKRRSEWWFDCGGGNDDGGGCGVGIFG